MAGHSRLVIEAGDDQGANINEKATVFQGKVTEDPAILGEPLQQFDESRKRFEMRLTLLLPVDSTSAQPTS
jgi:hypothetical protein